MDRNAAEVCRLQAESGYDVWTSARFCEVSSATYQRWRRDRPPSRSAFKLLQIAAGRMPWEGWERFEMYRGRIYSLEVKQDGIGPEDIGHLWLLKQRIQALEEDLNALRRRLAQLMA